MSSIWIIQGWRGKKHHWLPFTFCWAKQGNWTCKDTVSYWLTCFNDFKMLTSVITCWAVFCKIKTSHSEYITSPDWPPGSLQCQVYSILTLTNCVFPPTENFFFWTILMATFLQDPFSNASLTSPHAPLFQVQCQVTLNTACCTFSTQVARAEVTLSLCIWYGQLTCPAA